MGMAFSCIGVGVSNPRSAMACTKCSFNPNPSNEFMKIFFFMRRKGKLLGREYCSWLIKQWVSRA
jgi:hypothetical protein